MQPMSYNEFLDFARRVSRLAEPTVDRVEVNSKRELAALAEWVDRKAVDPDETLTPNLPTSSRGWAGIPVIIDDETPEGLLRLRLRDEIVAEIPIR